MRVKMNAKPAGIGAMSLWLITMTYFAASVLLGSTLPRFEHDYLPRLHSGISVATAQAFFSSITSGMMALTGILFSIAFVIAQFSSTAYSPRLTTIFSRDSSIFHALGLFIATFVFSLSTLLWVDRDSSGKTPFLPTIVVVLLLAASMVALVRLILRLNQLQLSYVLRFLGGEGRKAIREFFDDPYAATAVSAPHVLAAKAGPVTQVVKYAGEPLYLASLDIELLVERAKQTQALVVFECAVGDMLVDDAVVARIHDGNKPLSKEDVWSAVHLAIERTFAQDPKYAIRLLVDVAIKALSAAINDPTTAVQAIDQIEDLLSRLGRLQLSATHFVDDNSDLRLVVPTPTWNDFLSLAFDEIRLCGADSLQVMRRLRSALASLAATVAEGPRRDAVLRYSAHLDESVGASAFDLEDRAAALRGDKQGLGVTRAST